MAIAVIPARYHSTRFPGKPLADETGKPMICHVVDRAAAARRVERVIVATDDDRIAQAVNQHTPAPRPARTRAGRDAPADATATVEARLTAVEHPNGTSRIAEVVRALIDAGQAEADSVIVNVQGDEPEIDPGVIDALIAGLEADGDAPMATLAADFAPGENPADPNIVKLVTDRLGRAMYFSRSLIPFDREGMGVMPLKHPGLYAYRAHFVLTYAALPVTPLEDAEKLEQLRVLEHGHRIAVIKAAIDHHGIDTPEQYRRFVERHRATMRHA